MNGFTDLVNIVKPILYGVNWRIPIACGIAGYFGIKGCYTGTRIAKGNNKNTATTAAYGVIGLIGGITQGIYIGIVCAFILIDCNFYTVVPLICMYLSIIWECEIYN